MMIKAEMSPSPTNCSAFDILLLGTHQVTDIEIFLSRPFLFPKRIFVVRGPPPSVRLRGGVRGGGRGAHVQPRVAPHPRRRPVHHATAQAPL